MVAGVLPRPARHVTALLTSVLLLVILSFPVASGVGRPASPSSLPPHGLLSAPEHTPDQAAERDRATPRERAELSENPMVTVGPPASTCDQRSVLRDLPDAVPSCALRLAVWDQPWWPLPPLASDPLPEEVAHGALPPARAPPLTANTTV